MFAEFSLSGNDLQETQDCQLKDEPKDNRAIVDNNKAQSLTGEDIDEMRRWEHYIYTLAGSLEKNDFMYFTFHS